MRILRVRRGFTTNSSGDNEFLPIIPPPPASADASPDAAVTGARDAGTTQADASARTTAPDAGRHSSKDASVDAGVAVVAVNQPTSTTGAAPQGGSLTLVWVILGVVALFVAERVLRIVRRRAKEPAPEKPAGEKPAPEEPGPEKPGDDGQA